MFRFVIYKNSILATICSLFGSAALAMAVMGLFGQEIGILPAIGMIAAGVALIWLANVISDRKEQKKKGKTAKGASGAAAASSRQTAAPAEAGTWKGTSAAWAGAFFLLGAACSLFSAYRYSAMLHVSMGVFDIAEGVLCLLLAVGFFMLKSSGAISPLHAIGYLGLTVLGALDTWSCYRAYGFGGYSDGSGVYYSVFTGPLLMTIAFLLLSLFAFAGMKNMKNGAVRGLWFVPALLLIVAYTKEIFGSYMMDLLDRMMANGRLLDSFFTGRPELYDMLGMIFLTLAALTAGMSYRCVCNAPVPQVQQPVYAQSEVQYTAPQPVQTYAEPQPVQYAPSEPVYSTYTQHEPPQAASRLNQQELAEQMKAYKDLLDCGILTQAEYDQKISELMRG